MARCRSLWRLRVLVSVACVLAAAVHRVRQRAGAWNRERIGRGTGRGRASATSHTMAARARAMQAALGLRSFPRLTNLLHALAPTLAVAALRVPVVLLDHLRARIMLRRNPRFLRRRRRIRREEPVKPEPVQRSTIGMPPGRALSGPREAHDSRLSLAAAMMSRSDGAISSQWSSSSEGASTCMV